MGTSLSDLHQTVTDRILAAIEGGPGPWHRPWTGSSATCRPRNIASGKPYIRQPRRADLQGYAGRRCSRYGVGSKRQAFIVRAARERRLGQQARELTARLLSAPCAGPDDVALKLAVIIAAGEAGPPEAAAFPWVHLRRLLADSLKVTGA